MEYLKRDTLESAPAAEPTAFTMKSIREILAETGNADLLDAPAQPAAQNPAPQAAAPQPAAQPAANQPRVQRPPSTSVFGAPQDVQPRRPVQQDRTESLQEARQEDRRAANAFVELQPAKAPAQPAQRPGLGQRLSQALFGS